MKKAVGYTIALIGLGLMILGFGVVSIENELLSKYATYITPIGIGAVIIGAVIASKAETTKNKGPKKNEHHEVPIYNKEGHIVGYRRHH